MLRPVKRFCLVALFLVACRPEADFDPAAHEAEIRKWQETRDTRLRSENGWLTLVGLHWLEPGENLIGSGAANRVRLPEKAPETIGTLRLEDGTVTFEPEDGSGATIDGNPVTGPVQLRDDNNNDGPTLVNIGTMNFQIIRRDDRFGVRVKDPEAPTRVDFHGIDYFPIDPEWRVIARFEPYQPTKKVQIDDVTGSVSNQDVPGALVFEAGGETYRLDAIAEEGSPQLFVIFKDATSREETYPAGRYLYVPRPGVDGKVVVDFNKAYNPPCAFTPYATCPLPPPQNRLPLRIEAGEKNYKKSA